MEWEKTGVMISELSVCLRACMEGRGQGWPALCVGGAEGKCNCTHKSATRPVAWLMPIQVPCARTSRPESTLPLLPMVSESTWTADEMPSTSLLEAERVLGSASKEWK